MSLARVVKQRIARRESKLIITPVLEDWLASEGANLGVTDDEDMALAQRLLAASKDNAVRHGRFGASSRGMCHRRQVYAFLGLPGGKFIAPQLQNIFNDGTFRHIRWQLMGMKAGIFTNVEVPFKAPEWRLSTSLDGENDLHPWLFELKGWGSGKSIASLKNPENIPLPHMLQMHTMMFATGWDMAIYVAENKGSNNWAEVIVHRDEGLINEVRDELDILNTAIEDQAFPAIQEACRFKKGDYRDCPYGARCLKHHSQGSPRPTDERQWPGDEGTVVQVGRGRRPA